MSHKRAFLIHGWEGRPDNHWFPWMALELKANGFEVAAPQLPHAKEPKVREWLDFLASYVGKPNRDTYFVGHSLGCIAIVRYLAELPPKTRVGGCVFVAGFSGRLNIPEIREFYLPLHQIHRKDTTPVEVTGGASNVKAGGIANDKIWCGGELPFDAEKAREHREKSVMIFSDNDPYVPMEKSIEMARELRARTILERGKGHFTAHDGVTALPSALDALLRMARA